MNNEDFSDFTEMFSIPDLNNFSNMMPKPAQVPFSGTDFTFDALLQQIRIFESVLDDTHEIGVLFPDYGEAHIMTLTEVNLSGEVIVFSGFCGENPAMVFKPLSAPDFMLKALPVPAGTARRFFIELPENN